MNTSISAIAMLSAVIALASCTWAADEPAPLSAERSIKATAYGTVTAIDQATRVVTLKGSLGNEVTFAVDEKVKRLKEIMVGDIVVADYYVSLAGELRAPTEEEKAHPLVVVAVTARAPKDVAPAGGVLHGFKVVATVVGVDLPSQSVTLQGPRGNTGIIRAQDVEKLKQIKLGDTIVVTYTEAIAVELYLAPQPPK